MSLLERGNTRLAPLDTVEPDCWLCGSDSVDAFIVWKKCDADTALKDGLDPSPWYAEATVESMLSQCRKEALLEAAELQDKLAYGVAGAGVFPELLRRMAAGGK